MWQAACVCYGQPGPCYQVSAVSNYSQINNATYSLNCGVLHRRLIPKFIFVYNRICFTPSLKERAQNYFSLQRLDVLTAMFVQVPWM
jgi:hypothetical protein